MRFRWKFLPGILAAALLVGLVFAQAGIPAETPPKQEEPKKAQEKPTDTKEAEGQKSYSDGLIAMEHQNWKKAVESFKKAAELKPDSYNAWMFLAMSYDKLGVAHAGQHGGEHLNAISAWRQALKVQPKSAQAYLAIMEDYYQMGIPGMIWRTADDALANGVKPEAIYPNVAWYYYLNGDNAKAEENYKKALDINPKDFRTINNIGILRFSEGKYEEALQKYEEAAKLNPDSQTIPYLKALAYNKLGKERDALDALKEGIKKDPALSKKAKEYNEELFPGKDPGDLSGLFAKLQPPKPAMKNISGAAPVMKNISGTPAKK